MSSGDLINRALIQVRRENRRLDREIARQLPVIEHIARTSGDAEISDIARRFICKARA